MATSSINLDPLPEEAGRAGWGTALESSSAEKNSSQEFETKKGSTETLEGPIHFKKSVLTSFHVLETAMHVAYIKNKLQEPPETPLMRFEGKKPPLMFVTTYVELVSKLFQVDLRVAKYYSDVYRIARFSDEELTEDQYKDAMKCLVLLLKEI
jgi:hypothetical protein